MLSVSSYLMIVVSNSSKRSCLLQERSGFLFSTQLQVRLANVKVIHARMVKNTIRLTRWYNRA